MSKRAHQIRNEFIEFFTRRGHTYIHSSPVIPTDDPTLLFTNAGMNQFKSIFLGDVTPTVPRAVNSQKCMRVSGKHNDLEEVGRDHSHHTFFEMLGNWSFGDYYKKEAITWAWELLTEKWELPVDRLYATVYTDDDEAETLWKTHTGIAHDHIRRFGKSENFWQMGDTGPCGPCSEIHMDVGPGSCPFEKNPDHTCEVNSPGCGRFVEIWNLVFIQYNLNQDGSRISLAHTHIDTGMGLERISAILQRTGSNYETDLLKPLIDKVADMSATAYYHDERGMPMRVIADHIRALVFSITDGVFPSNEGRGYVIRRILRRAFRFGRKIGFREPFLHKLVDDVVAIMGEAYPEVTKRVSYVKGVIQSEEERFAETLEVGLDKLSAMIRDAKSRNASRLRGEDVFVLYDTYGFPADLTRLIAREEGIDIDEAEFESHMQSQKKRSREASDARSAQEGVKEWTELRTQDHTKFVGYERNECEANVQSFAQLSDAEDVACTCLLVLDSTPFYPQAGGQVGDTGVIILKDGTTLTVTDTYKIHDTLAHKVTSDYALTPENLSAPVIARIDTTRRDAIRRNHSVTHLLHAALRKYIGSHVQQSGSRVAPDELRFDFTHFEALAPQQLSRIEQQVNEWILHNLTVTATHMKYQDAIDAGITALFGEKYGDEVRVIQMDEVSRELCGGTHVRRTGDIGLFHITSESSISAGIRRLTAITGMASLRYLQQLETRLSHTAQLLKTDPDHLDAKVSALVESESNLRTRTQELLAEQIQQKAEMLISQARSHAGLHYAIRHMQNVDKKEFGLFTNTINDTLKQHDDAYVVILANAGENGVQFSATASPSAVKDFDIHCGNIVKSMAQTAGGGGGGRPDRAQAGAKKSEKTSEALQVAQRLMQEHAEKADTSP